MAHESNSPEVIPEKPPRFIDRALNTIERVGNKLPDPAVLFVLALAGTSLRRAGIVSSRPAVPSAPMARDLFD